MKRRAVIVRCGWGAAVVMCVLAIIAMAGGQDQPPLSPASLPPPAAQSAPRLPAYPPALLPPAPEFYADVNVGPVTPVIPPAPPREFVRSPAGGPIAPTPPAGAGPVIPAGGFTPPAPAVLAGPLAPAMPASPAVAPVPPGSVTPPVVPTAPGAVAPAPVLPAVPPGPVVPAAAPVSGAPTAPVVPVPRMAAIPDAPMPISPAAFTPPPVDRLPPPIVVPTAPTPAPAPAPTSPPAAAMAPAAPTPPAPVNSKVHPSKPATFPQPAPPGAPSAPATPSILPTPAVLQTQPKDPAPDPGSMGHPPELGAGSPAEGTPLADYWRHGLRFESDDRAFSLFVAGRTQFDVVNYLASTGMRRNIPGNVPLEDGVTFRRARIDVGGTIYKNFEFLSEFDFVNGFVTSVAENRLQNVVVPTDLWGQFSNLPVVGNLRVGNQKPAYGFEHLTSSRFLNFLERSLAFDAFVENFNNGFAPGIKLFDTFAGQRGTWALGLFKNTRNPYGWNVGRNEAELNGRLTFLPVYADGGRYLVHVGVGAAHRDLDDDQIRHRARLDARSSPSAFSPLVADTGLFFGSRQQMVIPEFVVVAGPWSFQSEYFASWVQRAAVPVPGGFDTIGTVYMQAVYGELHCFLTGEHREYSRESGAFTRVVPRRPLSWSRCGFGGCGAWQVAARYTYLDLNDKAISGGSIHDMTIGLNWFLNPNMKVQWNYFLAHRNVADPAGDGFIQGFGTRFALDF